MKKFDILKQIQDLLYKKYNIKEMYGPGFSSSSDTGDMTLSPDKPYVTHRVIVLPGGIKRKVKIKNDNIREEEEFEEEPAEEAPPEEQEEVPPEEQEEVPPEPGPEGEDMGMDSSMGMDPGMGMGEEEEKNPKELGRIYELKKIYSRLTSIEGYLGTESADELLEIRHYVSQAIELFEVISANFNSYKDKLNEIIIMYYNFIQEVYKAVKEFHQKVTKENINEAKITWKLPTKKATDEDLQIIEKKLRIILPNDFKIWVIKYNGSFPSPDSVNVSGTGKIVIDSSVSFSLKDSENIIKIKQKLSKISKQLVPIFSDGGGNYFCFRYKKEDSLPTDIVFWDHEEFENPLKSVAKTFTNFLTLIK